MTFWEPKSNNPPRKKTQINKPMNIKTVCRTLLAPTLVAVMTSATSATILTYDANLDGPSESPPNASPGTGFATATYDTSAHTLGLNITFSGLLGTTTASHIHAATASPGTGTAGVATTTPYFAGFPLGVTAGVYVNTLDLTQASSWNPSYITANGGTTAGAEAALAAALAGDKAYLNIHTTVVPGGEIRGFLVLVPEPSSLALLSLGGLALTLARRKAQRS
jgi:hypothetical protein